MWVTSGLFVIWVVNQLRIGIHLLPSSIQDPGPCHGVCIAHRTFELFDWGIITFFAPGPVESRINPQSNNPLLLRNE